jgi:predicted DNA-binding protein
MNSDSFKDQCNDITKEFSIRIPCMLAERVEAYAKKNKTTIAGVVIEALDTFLRKQKDRIG